MRLKDPEYIACEVLVIGGGAAGIRAAIAAREQGASVLMVCKSGVGLGNNTVLAKGGLSAALVEEDSPDIHMQDTLKAGCFINDAKLVSIMTSRMRNELSFLKKSGIRFQQDGKNILVQSAGGHSQRRFLRSEKSCGSDFTIPLRAYALKIGVKFLERVFISRLFIEEKEAIGAFGLGREGSLFVFHTRAIVLATGGLGQVYLHTDNAVSTTGDGYALAFYSGISLKDMEFIQFYPTTIRGVRILNYQSFVINAGAVIRNSLGEDVLSKHGLTNPLIMTRDRAARALMSEILEKHDVQGGLIMDISSVTEANFKRYHHLLPPEAILGKKEFIVVPTAHFTMGGVVIDEEAMTSIGGLFACGEVTGGIHGANRVSGNALSEAFTIGALSGDNAAFFAKGRSIKKADSVDVIKEKERLESLLGYDDDKSIVELKSSLKDITWHDMGIIRSKSGLERTINGIKELRFKALAVRPDTAKGLIKRLEIENMLLSAEMVSKAALARTESRGAHYRHDYPQEDPDWLANIFISSDNGEIKVEKKPIHPLK
jgi:fumarate reductase (CoM/CoB) subunit A